MFRSKQRSEQSKLSGKGRQTPRTEILLATLCLFSEHGKEEASLSEFQRSISQFEKEFPLGYDFFETFLCSLDLLTDLENLGEQGYTRRYTYSHDSLLPKNFIRLMPLGRWHAKKIIQTLSADIIEALNKAIISAIGNYKKTWGSWAR